MIRTSMSPAWVALFVATSAMAMEHNSGVDLTELSLQELTNVKVTTLAKRPQRAADVSAALFVITQDDIRRAGATSIPGALRLAPGLQVSRIDGNKWAISARGFSGRFANKLLVLMDGRTLYTPSFAGVYWDAQDTLIDDIERIEVIRGPAGTTWGTNAVNGIINIITKRADVTDGLLFSSDVGIDGSSTANIRFGDADDADKQWRVYAKAFELAANERANGRTAYDDQSQQRIGGRLDYELGIDQSLRFAAEAYQGRSGDTFTGTFMDPNVGRDSPMIDTADSLEGAWALGGWTHDLASGARLELQMYADHSDRDGPVFGERRDTFDLDFQHGLSRWQVHVLTWGLGVRYTQSVLKAIDPIVVDDRGARLLLGSAYIQDEINLFADRVTVTAGARIEDSNLDDLEVMPNLRARVAVTEQSSVWGAIGRGVRRGGRIEQDFIVDPLGDPIPAGESVNPFPVPAVRTLLGNPDFKSEVLMAYEAGWRWQAHEDVSIDAALYYNAYDRLRSLGMLPPYCTPGGETLAEDPTCLFTTQSVTVPATAANNASGHIKGGEIVTRWTPLAFWRLTATYSRLDISLRGVVPDPATELFIRGTDPEHQYSLRSSLSVGPRWDWDVFVKHRSEVTPLALDSMTQLDARIAWRPTLDLELALVGRNLLEDAEVEAASELFDLDRVAIERDAYLQLRWSFR